MKVDVGCGENPRKGYTSCDLRPLPGVEIVCKAWELSSKAKDIQAIYSRHMVEHLTRDEFTKTLQDWLLALEPGGELHIICPNLDFHLEQLRSVKWNDEVWHDSWSNGRHGLAGLYGSQRECHPDMDNYNSSYWDVHKFGYTAGLMQYLLESHGYDNVSCETDNAHLHGRARKPA